MTSGPAESGTVGPGLCGPVDLTGLPPVAGTLADLMPAVAAAVGVRTGPTVEDPLAGDRPEPAVVLPPARNAVVVLVDGLGDLLLERRGGHAPFLRRLRGAAGGGTLTSGFPSTTATSMAMLGTGTLPGSHGLVGLEVLDPARDVLFNELAWDPEVDPRRWQPLPTVFEALAGAGHDVVRVGPAYFDGSGLTEAALRGGRFVAAAFLDDRVEATLAAIRRAPRTGPGVVVYLYWGELDKTGHVYGSGSFQWGEQLAAVDGAVRALVSRLRSDTGDVVTAMRGELAVVDSRTARPEVLRLLGLHGARTPDEALVPLMVTHGTAR